MLSQLKYLIMGELILSYGSKWSLLNLIYLTDTGLINSWFTYVHKDVLVIAQDFIRINEQHLWTRIIDSAIGLFNQVGPFFLRD